MKKKNEKHFLNNRENWLQNVLEEKLTQTGNGRSNTFFRGIKPSEFACKDGLKRRLIENKLTML